MPRNLHADVISLLDQDNLDFIVMCEVNFDAETIRLCSRLKSISYSGGTYQGVGTIGAIGNITENKNLDPSSCKITLAGTNDGVLSSFSNNDHLNRDIKIMVALLDSSRQIIGEPIDHFVGTMDTVNVNYGRQSTVEIMAKDRLADWDRRQSERWTHEEQQLKYPGDLGFEYITEIRNKQITWPKASWFNR